MQHEFIFSFNHEALKYRNSHQKLSQRHAKWVSFLQGFTFSIRHKAGSQNKVADALSRRRVVLTVNKVEMQGFNTFKELYFYDKYFGPIIQAITTGQCDNYCVHNGKGLQLCVSDCSLNEKIIIEQHALGHFGHDKSIALMEAKYFWPKLKRDVTRYVERCHACQLSKGSTTNAVLYNPLPTPSTL